ncbi:MULTISPECIES: glycoside hydrolase family 108 protein [unclassified Tenacibaculum]|uniref:glycoside hydrolase family 108 protein n=1 Tax=unclassified Tenacibaculum TaxID=2635139 RepID=UPI001F236743|nr:MULTISPECIES: glycosyl hydrolase 108 family protein [unclassified Tenacibaculum]MCF2875430.1 hypothetical protein [Tenacibaculum sp. Cn5-1]MCF2935506.1 hypothetical protein [Tenacibaculum sp. Cn5-34]MCG7512066.1 hypothetical protein [Tenacibaculum sp. Cn5-46]
MANYEIFKASIQSHEGGYQNIPTDWGNYNSKDELVGTNFGVSARFYERVIGRPPTQQDMLNITQQEAHILFKNEFWDKVLGDYIDSQEVAETIADHAINSQPYKITKIVQRVLNNEFGKNLKVDGLFGAKTLAAVNSVDYKKLFIEIGLARKAYYESRPDFNHHGRSWLRRLRLLSEKFNIVIKKKVA